MKVSALYIHVPFCLRKCKYCDFISYPCAERGAQLAAYASLVEQELQLYDKQSVDLSQLRTVYFGGGTPSLLNAQDIHHILSFLPDERREQAEITLEANPETVDGPKLLALRQAGVNRISFGVQSFKNAFLQEMGRGHSAQQAVDAVKLARSAGFENISLDLIYGLPGQSLNQWRADLETAVALQTEHISLYSLSLEPGTPWGEASLRGALTVADEDLSADMLELAIQQLKQAGFLHYEISNFARPGYQSQHNCAYWRRDNYLGVGVAAASCLANHRFSNVTTIEQYDQLLQQGKIPVADEELLDIDDVMAEAVFLGLRLAEGISFSDFQSRYGTDVRKRFRKQIARLNKAGLLACDEQGMRLTERGMMLGNQAFIEFV